MVVGEAAEHAQQDYNEGGAAAYTLRSPEEIGRFFEGLDLVEPGLVSCPLWRPESDAFGTPDPVDAFGAVARKP